MNLFTRLTCLFLSIISLEGMAQNFAIDTTKIVFTAKLKCFEAGIYDEEEFQFFLNRLSVKWLQSSGFNSNRVIFILIKKRKSATDTISNISQTINQDVNSYKLNKILGDCDYVMAYSLYDNLFYRLKGFRENDFEIFIEDQGKSDPIVGMYKRNREQFIQRFTIEDLEISCLWDRFIKKKKSHKYSCDISCFERDKKGFVFK